MSRRFTKEQRQELQTKIITELQRAGSLLTAHDLNGFCFQLAGNNDAAFFFNLNDSYRLSVIRRTCAALAKKGLLVEGYGYGLRGITKAYMAA